ncbi:MAG: hypothetical protein KKC29_05940 [Alphaproteobacteria bacterium]|jgi:hypothetical protein|nr:hypothetical protein [Alphaproteobacteria bacterium]MBU2043039.1 hypothetical protein [Alphaproteobacteria bacterium]MBU2126533.1 hypothetical protein [Alphaproteobacteria bacterium]MBU2208537.1 hypothetical protein [Alphaproteobacteria bacterium]MBU2290621.1 hypothetical protein [Alphaproteobacteria bacterium]
MKPVTFLVVLLGLTACDAQVESRKAALPAEQAAPAAAPLTAAGPAAIVQPDADEGQQWAASVVELTPLTRQGDRTVKLFGTAGGDPAMNGLYTHVAFYDSPAEGWRVFRIGDVLDYRVLSESEGRVDLELNESTMDQASGEIGSRTRRVIVGWALPADGSVPATVTVTPAQ